MQVTFFTFFHIFLFFSYIDMGVEFMSHIIHYVTTNFKKIFHTVCTEIISCIQGTALHFCPGRCLSRNTESFPVFFIRAVSNRCTFLPG